MKKKTLKARTASKPKQIKNVFVLSGKALMEDIAAIRAELGDVLMLRKLCAEQCAINRRLIDEKALLGEQIEKLKAERQAFKVEISQAHYLVEKIGNCRSKIF